jgi:hypothetical protein
MISKKEEIKIVLFIVFHLSTFGLFLETKAGDLDNWTFKK